MPYMCLYCGGIAIKTTLRAYCRMYGRYFFAGALHPRILNAFRRCNECSGTSLARKSLSAKMESEITPRSLYNKSVPWISLCCCPACHFRTVNVHQTFILFLFIPAALPCLSAITPFPLVGVFQVVHKLSCVSRTTHLVVYVRQLHAYSLICMCSSRKEEKKSILNVK